MGAAWKNPKERDFNAILAMVEGVKALGLETCMTLGSLTQHDAVRLKGAGLDYYNHNIDTSERYYSEIVTTRTFGERLDTLDTCAVGLGLLQRIVGEGEGDQVDMLVTRTYAHPKCSDQPPDPIQAPRREPLDPLEFMRTIALPP
jgi:biotin synthase